MNFNFQNLDRSTRQLMSDEIKYDIDREQLYFSRRFNETGYSCYIDILQNAVANGDEETFGISLKERGCFKTHEERKTKSGITLVKIPETANITFAESEFNRFYIRALCLKAIETGQQLLIYRARYSENPRVESEMLVNQTINPQKLLTDLRNNIGIDTALGLPPGPNSGLTVKL